MQTSYHVHSRWSDGEGELAEFVRAAKRIGLDELGFSDHYVISRDGAPVGWSMPVEAVDDYVTAVRSAMDEAGESMTVRLGIEADFIPETADTLKNILSGHVFDYVIGSVHLLDGFPIDESAEHWERLSQDERDSVIRRYWVRIREMAGSGLFDIAGHLDLTKKFGFRPSVDLQKEIAAALDSIAESGMTVEINTSGCFTAGEAYPEPSIIRGCFRRGIPVLVTADAHTPENLTRGYEDAYRLLRDIGYTEIASFAGRKRIMCALPGVE